ncbi:hypothetical protein [Terrihabitans sp. B22-R8]|uniref:hypothetical protein n=1 Tax=Terrihabitans sp. B22-R8 TaxID=3425128 RepID=UPI00403CD160
MFAIDQARSGTGSDGTALERWTDAVPVAAEARQARVDQEVRAWREGRADPDAVEAALSNLLAIRPAHGAGWAALASARLARGAPLDDVVAAMDVSSWVAPRESAVMIARTDLGLRIWEHLDRAHQVALVTDLVAIGSMISEEQMGRLQMLLRTRSDDEREVLSGMVAARSGGTLPPWAEWLGL